MHFTRLSVVLGALSAARALPTSPKPSEYAVKETHAVPRDWLDVGSAAKDEVIHLQIGLKQRNEGVVEQHLLEISDPSHERYGQHLSAAEVDEIVTPSDETVELVHAWLAEHGVEDVVVHPAKDWISVVVPIEKAESLLRTSYKTFRHADGTTMSRAPEWSLPAHLHEHIDVVQPTTSFFRVKKEVQTSAKPLLDSWSLAEELFEQEGDAGNGSVANVCKVGFTTLKCLRTLYGTIDYTPQVPTQNKIGICNYLNETNHRSDVKKFLRHFRPAAVAAADEFEIEIIANAHNNQGPYTPTQITNGHNIEGDLDAELVLGITWPTNFTAFSTGGSPPFRADLYTPSDTNEPYLTFLNYILAQAELPQVISSSYGDDEQTVPPSYAARACQGFAQLGARGVSVLVSSGDSGVGADGTCYSNADPSKRMYVRFQRGEQLSILLLQALISAWGSC